MARRKTVSIATLGKLAIVGVGVVTLAMTLVSASDAAFNLGLGYSWNDVGFYAAAMLWAAIAGMISGLMFFVAGDR